MLCPTEIRSEGDETKSAEQMLVGSYVTLFGKKDSYGDIIAKGAFDDVTDGWIPLLYQHDPTQPIGTFKAEVVKTKGLRITEVRIARKNANAEGIAALIEARAVTGLSIGFTAKNEDREKIKDGTQWNRVNLWETSIVTFPALPEARIAASTDQALVRELGDVRDELAIQREQIDVLTNQLNRFQSERHDRCLSLMGL